MYLVECTPLSRNMRRETLSYFVSTEPTPGSVVTISLRNKKVPALVMKSSPLINEKINIKEAPYSLKKIQSRKKQFLFLSETINSAVKTADYFASSPGAILNSFTPAIILENFPETTPRRRKRELSVMKYSFQSNLPDRLIEYRSLIRESFSKGESIFFLLPTTEDCFNFSRELERGIEKYTFSIEGSMKAPEITTAWKSILKINHPVLIIGTPFALTIPRGDIGTIVVEKESSRVYIGKTNPYPDGRKFAESLAIEYKANLILADSVLRVETLYRESTEELTRFTASKARLQSEATSNIIDMKKETLESGFAILGEEAKKIIENSLEENERVVVYGARKGLYPETVCSDCGNVVNCKNCKKPLVLHERGETSYFLCHTCGERYDTSLKCSFCQSWNLKPIGIGIDLIEETIRALYKNANLFVLSGEKVSTSREARNIASNFYTSPRSILLGTEFMLPYLIRQFENSIIVSIDSLLSIPDYKINEKIFNTCVTLRANSTKNFLLQTRHSDKEIFRSAIRGDIASFYESEIENRKIFGFPPFFTHIKLSIEGSKEISASIMQEISELLSEWKPVIFPAFMPGKMNKKILSAIIKIKSDEYPNQNLIEKLRSLPLSVKIEVEPDMIV